MDVQHMATVVHLRLERRTVVRLIAKVLLENQCMENYKISTNRGFVDDIVRRLSYYIIFITFFDGMRLKGIFLRALSGL